jgi:hypothetical protein
MGANAFVAARVVLDVSFDAARCRLGRLARDGVLLGASEYAYGVGATGLAEAAGRAAGMSRLAGVRPGDLAETPDQAWLWLRWDAIASDGPCSRRWMPAWPFPRRGGYHPARRGGGLPAA